MKKKINYVNEAWFKNIKFIPVDYTCMIGGAMLESDNLNKLPMLQFIKSASNKFLINA